MHQLQACSHSKSPALESHSMAAAAARLALRTTSSRTTPRILSRSASAVPAAAQNLPPVSPTEDPQLAGLQYPKVLEVNRQLRPAKRGWWDEQDRWNKGEPVSLCFSLFDAGKVSSFPHRSLRMKMCFPCGAPTSTPTFLALKRHRISASLPSPWPASPTLFTLQSLRDLWYVSHDGLTK